MRASMMAGTSIRLKESTSARAVCLCDDAGIFMFPMYGRVVEEIRCRLQKVVGKLVEVEFRIGWLSVSVKSLHRSRLATLTWPAVGERAKWDDRVGPETLACLFAT